jgi:radical SAM superfamily enzyme YgiQ (UPF0313 family)
MKNNILLVSSSFEDISLITASNNKPKGIKTGHVSHYPLGLGYLHACLESCGYNVKSLFLNNYEYKICFDMVIKNISEFSPEVIGLQMLTSNRVSSYRLIEYIHGKYPEIQLVIGGIHATLMYEQLIKKYPYIIAVLGEGEITLTELVKSLTIGSCDLSSIDGIAFSRNGIVTKTRKRSLLQDLDSLPFPKHDQFFNSDRISGCIITSRGCPFSCSFCCLDAISGRKVRFRSINNVIDEIELMTNKFPTMTNIWIHDDSFLIDTKRAINFCDEIIRRKIGVEFICSSRMKPINKELINKLEQANFKQVLLGLESGDAGILKSCHKGITQKDALYTIDLFSRSTIEIYAFLIVGLPGENIRTVWNTIEFIKKLQKIKYIYYDNIALLTVYPGTEIYEIAKARGELDDDFWLTEKPTPLYTVDNHLEELFIYKELMLDHISMDRFFTKAGLSAQINMLPYIIKYLISSKRIAGVFVISAAKFLKYTLPENLYVATRKTYRQLKKRVLLRRMAKLNVN